MDNNEVDDRASSVSVLFVCLGNICNCSTGKVDIYSLMLSLSGRSPMAEATFRSLSSSESRISLVDSAGTGAYHTGDSPDPRTISTLEDKGIGDYEHGARKIRSSDFSTFDYILAMDKDNLRDLRRTKQRLAKSDGDHTAQVMLFGDFGGRIGEEIIDPYYGARDGFEVAYEQAVRFSKGFLKQVLGKGEEMSP
ncbi:hypothetical protein MMC12_006381 [Toensbergia leucococca]|nr:hypothetical protein [Toensbergia leucococca]